MKTYYRTKQPGVIFDAIEGFSFDEGSEAHKRVLAEVERGESRIEPAPPAAVIDLRQRAYVQAGLSHADMLVALWELVVEGRPEKASALQALRDSVKSAHPKSG